MKERCVRKWVGRHLATTFRQHSDAVASSSDVDDGGDVDDVVCPRLGFMGLHL